MQNIHKITQNLQVILTKAFTSYQSVQGRAPMPQFNSGKHDVMVDVEEMLRAPNGRASQCPSKADGGNDSQLVWHANLPSAVANNNETVTSWKVSGLKGGCSDAVEVRWPLWI